MAEGFLAMASVLLGGVIAIFTQYLSHRREDRREMQSRRERQVEDLKALYEEAIFTLDRNARALGRGTREEGNETRRILARLRLLATNEILSHYMRTADALDAWAAEARKGEPRRVASGLLMISSNDKHHQLNAESIYPEFAERFESLQHMMRNHINSLQRAA